MSGISSLYFFDMPQREIVNLYESGLTIFLLAFLFLLLYAILSGYKNIYRRYTVKQYSPMSRALAEQILDPLIIFLELIENPVDYEYVILAVLYTFNTIFCSCVYNEVIILYCCGLEKNTFLEIMKRGDDDKISIQLIDGKETVN